jgi:outer membrane protein assembly factor BamA
MTKLRLQIWVILFLLVNLSLAAQSKYSLFIRTIDRDSSFEVSTLGLQTTFNSRNECSSYISQIPANLQARGFVTASLDSISYDSAFARVVLYIGNKYEWAQLETKQIDPSVLQAVGWRDKTFSNEPMDFLKVQQWQEKILTFMENSGHPFAKVYLDSLQIENERVWAQLKLEKGPAYKIDSIRILGSAKISNDFLQRYLDIRNGSLFSREKLLRISRRMRELPYVEEEYPAKLIWLGTGSTLEMYLKQKRSSQVNVLVGFLPNNDQLASNKLLITGEANLNLKNELGAGETIGLNWQQLQVKSPRLSIIYQHPYIFKSPVGLDFAFDMFRKDSTFLNVNLQLGAQYILNTNHSGKVFLQRFQSIVSGIDTNYILQTHSLPDEADVRWASLGVDYEYNSTNYRLNPIKGSEFRIITTVGTKKIKENSEVLGLKDPSDPSFDFGTLYDTIKLNSYQFRIRASAAKYRPLGRQNRSTFKTAINAGFFQSENIFRNELFQIGGYKLLRGFDEESQYLSQFIIGTLEYRYLVGQNSFFYVFSSIRMSKI